MNATTIGAVLALIGVLSGSVVAYIGKRGENATSRFNSVTDQIQEELDRKAAELAAAKTELSGLHQQCHDDLIRMAKLEIEVNRLGGTIPP